VRDKINETGFKTGWNHGIHLGPGCDRNPWGESRGLVYLYGNKRVYADAGVFYMRRGSVFMMSFEEGNGAPAFGVKAF